MKSITKTIVKMVLTGSLFAIIFSSCHKDQKNTPTPAAKPDQISTEVLAKITAAGFSTDNVIKVKNGYLVEGDIVLTEAFLNSNITKPTTIVTTGKSKLAIDQYRVTNPISPANQYAYVTYKISANGLASGYVSALTEAISRYNNLYLDIRFSLITTGTPDITLSTFNAVSTLEGQSGFPVGGVPYNSIPIGLVPIQLIFRFWHPLFSMKWDIVSVCGIRIMLIKHLAAEQVPQMKLQVRMELS